MRQRIHLRLCAAVALVSLPVAATTSNALRQTPVVGSLAGGPAALADPTAFTGSMGRMQVADPGTVAQKVRETGRQGLQLASPGGVRISDAMDDLGIPRPALVAYQVAAATMAHADPACGLDWSLLAAIGRVETDHGRYAGAVLGGRGVSRPHIRGVALNGTGPFRSVPDTDGGQLDGDEVWDRAVGPMQFLPSTWAYAGVDADGNGSRNPDDLDDAALAAAVYLCAAAGSVDDTAGLRTAVHRYNQSQSYVDLVVQLAEAYRSGNAVDILPTSTMAMGRLAPGAFFEVFDAGPALGRPSGDAGSGGPGKSGDAPDRAPDGEVSAAIIEPGETLPGTVKEDPPSGPSETPEPPPTDEPTPTDQPEPTPDPAPDPDTEPHPDTDFEPGTDSEPDTKPEPAPAPEPAPEEPPAPAGVLTLVAGQWYLDERLLDVGDGAWLATTALADHDGDTVLETNCAELSGLVGRPVDVAVDSTTGAVLSINGRPYLG